MKVILLETERRKGLPGVPWWLRRLRIWHYHCCGSGHCCNMGSIPGGELLHTQDAAKKKKKTKVVARE